jgi:heptosyltransferase-2
MRIVGKILLIRFSSLGDIVLASPLIRMLRTSFPTAQIDFMVKREYADLLKCNPHLSSVIELRSDDRAGLAALRERVRHERYDLILDIHDSLRSKYVRALSGARSVRVVNKRRLRRFILVRLKKNFYRRGAPVAERYLETVRRFGVRDDGAGLEQHVPPEIVESVGALMAKFRLERYGTVIGIAPMARHFTKRWPQERFVEFGIRYAKEAGAKILIFGSREETDACGDIAQMINAATATGAAESLAGRLTLIETAAVLDYCSLVVTNDSGLMHLAAARKRKVAAIFGSTVREFGFFPYGTENIVLERTGLPCRPCSHIGLAECPKGHFRCMKEIGVDEVLAAARALNTRVEQPQPVG